MFLTKMNNSISLTEYSLNTSSCRPITEQAFKQKPKSQFERKVYTPIFEIPFSRGVYTFLSDCGFDFCAWMIHFQTKIDVEEL